MKDIAAVHKSLLPTLEVMEEKRKTLLKLRGTIYYIAFGIVAVICCVFFFFFKEVIFESPPLFFMPILVTLVVCFAIYSYKRSKMVLEYKNQVISKVFQAIDESFHYNPENRVSKEEFKASKLFRRPDRYNGEDFVKGRLDKTDFTFSEIHAEYKRRSKKKTTYHTIFKGFLMIADFHKDFCGHTVVRPDGTGETWMGRLFKKNYHEDMQITKMENPIFEDAFDVYTTDQVEARYILSTSMLENILKLKERFKCTIHIAFLNSSAYIAIEWNKAFLEPNIENSLLEESTIHQFLDDIWLCLDIIEEMNLNTRIWSKQ